MKYLGKIYIALLFVLLFFPVVVMVIYSFNANQEPTTFTEFSAMWYEEMLYDTTLIDALKNSLVLALSSTAVSTLLGTVAALGIYRIRRKWIKSTMLTVTNMPMMNPEIVIGVSFMLLFTFVGGMLGLVERVGFITLLIAHSTFSLPYVVLNVLPKLRQMDPHLVEAAQDLGSSPMQAFMKVTLPSIASGVASGALMAFTLSLDDFVISKFTGGGFVTLPVYIYNMTRHGVKTVAYTVFTCIFLIAIILLVVKNVVQIKSDIKKRKSF